MADEQSITCPDCGMTSHHPEDIRYGYCGNCQDFTTPSVNMDHPLGCFYGSFAGAYPDSWHIPHGVDCSLPHPGNVIWLGPPGGEAP